MDRVSVDLKHCYGIKALKQDFDFSQQQAYAIYAPNGVMKSSLAQTFHDLSKGVDSRDRIFTARVNARKITDQTGANIKPESIFVVFPYDQEFGPSDKTSTLLVDAELRRQHERLSADIEKATETLMSAIKVQSKSKRNFETELVAAFVSDDLKTALTRIKKEVQDQKDTPFATVQYDKIFDDRVISALDTKDLKSAIEEYIRRYNELLAASTYFRKGTFDYYNGGQIAKTLADNGFFTAKHTINLKDAEGKSREIHNRKDLEEVINKEKEAILKDTKLRKQFDEVAAQLGKNATLREFEDYLMVNEALLSRMNNIPKFKQDILKSYLKSNEQLYLDLMSKYDAAEAGLEKIAEAAASQKTQWEDAIAAFNERFLVPFRLVAKNKIAVMLGQTPTITLGFTYHDGVDEMPIEKAALISVLSNGEKKALYILNVIFEVETRRKAQQETLIVVDDLADSFDYRNKYAIVQYLKDISEDGLFKLLIMTHNFDFFRTIQSRFIRYDHCLMTTKSDTGLELIPAEGIKNIFAEWKKHFFSRSKEKIACIPFLRNLVEFTKGANDTNFLKLTSLLHWKPDSATIQVADLDAIYHAVCAHGGASANGTKLVHELITEEADSCMGAGAGMNFENKIVLAIAIRLAAERFMVQKINDPAFVASINSFQTQALMQEFKRKFPAEHENIAVLDHVALMTPENIHLNSFMYEPIVDMSDEHLKKLYGEAKNLA